MAPRGPSEDPKVTALRESRCLNPHPEQVTDEAFQAVLANNPDKRTLRLLIGMLRQANGLVGKVQIKGRPLRGRSSARPRLQLPGGADDDYCYDHCDGVRGGVADGIVWGYRNAISGGKSECEGGIQFRGVAGPCGAA